MSDKQPAVTRSLYREGERVAASARSVKARNSAEFSGKGLSGYVPGWPVSGNLIVALSGKPLAAAVSGLQRVNIFNTPCR